MSPQEFTLSALRPLLHSPVRNYVVPGLTSWLIRESAEGTIRLFHSERTHEEPIAPHSHRFDFTALVLRGSVRNRIWFPRGVNEIGDLFRATTTTYNGRIGDHTKRSYVNRRYVFMENTYRAGETYSMDAADVHSIFFERDTWVLFVEGPQKSDKSVVLEPVVDNELIPTFRVEPWMFRRCVSPSLAAACTPPPQ